MTESTVTPFEDFSQRLRRRAAERDGALAAIDNDYAKGLARGVVGDLYTPYLSERESVINMFKLDAISIGKEYTQGAPASSSPLPAPPAPSAAYPAPHHRMSPAMTGNQPIQQPEVRKRRSTRKAKLIGFVGAGILTLGLIATITSINNGRTANSSSSGSGGYTSSVRTVVYEVEGTAKSVDITMESTSGTSQQSNLKVPLSSKSGSRGLTLEMNRGDFVYISAQNQGSSGSVTCRITVDGVVVSTVTSSGGYTIATCSGTAP